MERDMTAGIPGKIILNFTIPIFIGNMFQQIYNLSLIHILTDIRGQGKI